MDRGAWKAAVHGVAEGRTQLSDFTFTFHFRSLEKEMATHSSVLAWRISGTGEPGGLPSMGSHRVGHDWSDLAAAAFSLPDLRPTFWISSPSCYIQRQITRGREGRNSSSFVSDSFYLTKGHSWGYVFMQNVEFIDIYIFYPSIICCYLNVVNSIQQNYIITQFFFNASLSFFNFFIFLVTPPSRDPTHAPFSERAES